jgi:hypothetical protein
VLPSRRNDRSDSELPICRKSKTDKVEPSRVNPYIEIVLPIRQKLRRLSDDPSCTKSRTLSDDPIFMTPCSEICDP